jgi:O-antigen/teichoic acid export membrane protein
MGDIRRQSISSSIFIYIGFAFGALNTLLLTKEGYFTPDQYGMTQAMVSINQVFFPLACFGMVSVMGRFYPYYYDSLRKNQNDLLTLALVVSLIGFTLLCIAGVVLKPLFIQKFLSKAPALVKYYFWLFPFTFFYLIFSILETHSAIYKKTVFPNFLREGAVRMITTILIGLYIIRWISFDAFVKLFACIYAVTAFLLWFFLWKNGEFVLVFKRSRVTKKKGREIFQFVAYIYAGIVIAAVGQQIDSIVIANQKGLAAVGVFSLCQYIATVVQVPQRSMVAIASPYIAQAWKDNNLAQIQNIYFKSSINLLIIALLIFCNIWLNLDVAYEVFELDKAFVAGKYVVLLLGITKIIDMGTGVNSQLLYTSPSWRFEFYIGVALMFLAIPLNYIMVKNFGIMGAAYYNVIYFSVYNAIRIIFIQWKYKLQPFSINTLKAIILTLVIYFPISFIMQDLSGILGMAAKSIVFTTLFVGGVYYMKLTPDLQPLLDTLTSRLRRR